MRAVIIGAGAVGGAIAKIAGRRRFLSDLVVADVDPHRAMGVAAGAAEGGLHTKGVFLDATDTHAVEALLRDAGADVVVNACDPRLNPPIFEAAFRCGANYLDMAMNLSEAHPTKPYELLGRPLGEAQLAAHERWARQGRLAIVAMGVEPGLSDVFARYLADEEFSVVHEVAVRDGNDLVVEGFDFAPTFSIWTTIEECLNPPIVYERSRGFFTTEPFSDPEAFEFPEGIGVMNCVNVEHEEVLLVPRVIDCDRVTFKYGLGQEFIDVLQMLHKVGLDRTATVNVRGMNVSPRDVVAATLPNPAELGDRMHGRTCAGTYMSGLDKAGQPKAVYQYHVADNATTMRDFGCQAVGWQTALGPVVALELMARGIWSGVGVCGPESFPAAPVIELLGEYGAPARIEERDPLTRRAVAGLLG